MCSVLYYRPVMYVLFSVYIEDTVDVKKLLQNHSQNIISIMFNRQTNMILLLLLEDFNVLMLTDCKFVDL